MLVYLPKGRLRYLQLSFYIVLQGDLFPFLIQLMNIHYPSTFRIWNYKWHIFVMDTITFDRVVKQPQIMSAY